MVRASRCQRGGRGFESPLPLHRSRPFCETKRDGHIKTKMYTVYVLKSLKDGRTYVGCSRDLKNRVNEHNAGEVKSTKSRILFVVWYKEEFTDKYSAFKRERHFKTSWGRRQLRKILDKIPV